MKKNLLKTVFIAVVDGILTLVHAAAASAATSTGMPWETPLETIMGSVTGPVAKVIGVLAIFSTAIGFAIAEEGSWIKKGLAICIGLSVAFSASTFILPILGYTGGAVFK